MSLVWTGASHRQSGEPISQANLSSVHAHEKRGDGHRFGKRILEYGKRIVGRITRGKQCAHEVQRFRGRVVRQRIDMETGKTISLDYQHSTYCTICNAQTGEWI